MINRRSFSVPRAKPFHRGVCLLLSLAFPACQEQGIPPPPIVERAEADLQRAEHNNPALAAALVECREAYTGLAEFRTQLFDDACSQGRSIVCASDRLSKLARREQPWDYPEGQAASTPLDRLLRTQSFIAIEVHQENSYYRPLKYITKIPLASPYGHSCHVLQTDQCAEHYQRPIPTSTEALDLETAALAEELALSLRRLRFYQDKLPELEIDISTVTALEISLRKLESEANLMAHHPSLALINIEERREYLNQIVQGIADVRRQVPLASSVGDAELQIILEAFQ